MRILLTLLTALDTVCGANAGVYAVGAFNNWDISHPVVFDESDGLYCATIDFSNGQSFKISTAYPSGNDNSSQWISFDTGTFVYEGTPQTGRWIDIFSQPKSGNLHSPSAAKLTVTVDLTSMKLMYSLPEVSEDVYSHTLPVLYINTEGNAPITSKSEYLAATYRLDPMDAEGVEAIGTKESPLPMQIRGRGNYTWTGFKKKPYRLKLEKKQPLLGMTKSKHWALMANADDNLGMLRNVAGFAASRVLGMPWTPAQRPCEVILNGEYIGLYFLTETIRVDEDRVDITEQSDLSTTDVDGGWLVEIDNYDSDPHVTVNENGRPGDPIWFTYKSPELLSAEQSDYLTSAMSAIDRAVYSSETELRRLVDFDVLARYYIVQELLDDTESFHGSCYLYRDRGEECKWMFGPVWDFGNAYRRVDYRQFIWQRPAFRQVWIGSICSMPGFMEKVREVWGEFLDGGPERLNEEISAVASEVQIAADYDFRRWPEYGTDREMERCQSILARLSEKTEWLKTQWGSEPVGEVESALASGTEAEYFNMHGLRVANPASGLLIERRGGKVRKILKY